MGLRTLIEHMRLELLGPGRLLAPAGEVVLRAGLPLALLAYLYRSGAPLPREHLAALFWPGRPRPLALQSLRQALRRLRSVCGEGVVEGEGRHLALGASAIGSSDVTELAERVREGDATGALALWQGSFLEDFRLPRSWEVEDWLERERSGLAGMLLTCVAAAVREHLDAGDAAGALDLLHGARSRFPHREDLLEVQAEALLASGRLAEAAGRLGELRIAAGEEEVEELEERLESALRGRRPGDRGASAGEPDGVSMAAPAGVSEGAAATAPDRNPEPMSGPAPPLSLTPLLADAAGPPDPPAPGRRRLGWALALLGAAVLVIGGGWWVRPDPLDRIAEGLEDWRLLYCHAAATGGRYDQPAWMALDGADKHRIHTLSTCHLVWVEGARSLLALQLPLEEGEDYRLVRLEPPAENPIAEWRRVPLASTAGLSSIQFTLYGDMVLDGRLVPFTGVDSTGVRGLYLVDVATDTIRRVDTGPGDVRYPTLDLVRREVVFSREREGPAWDLWAVPLDDPGAEPVRLTESPSEDSRAAVHGDRILFNRGWGEGPTEGDLEIRLLDRSTGREEVLVSNPWNEYMADWSPDGRHICWQSDEFGHFESEIHVMEVETRRSWSLTRGAPGRDAGCHWTPDGSAIVFQSYRDGGIPQTFLSDPQGRQARNLSRVGASSGPAGFIPARW